MNKEVFATLCLCLCLQAFSAVKYKIKKSNNGV